MKSGASFADIGYVLTPIFPRIRAWRQLYGLLLVGSFVLLSFLPPSAKLFLHTRGPLHLWAHLYLFAAMTVMLLNGAASHRQRLLCGLGLALLGCSIEFLQAGWQWPAIELRDIAGDLFGLASGLFLWWLRAEANWSAVGLAPPLPDLDAGW